MSLQQIVNQKGGKSPVLYKPSGTIYYSAPLGLTARKIMNALLYEGQRIQANPSYKRGDNLNLELALSDLLTLISWGKSKNISYLKDILTSLVGTTISWDSYHLDNTTEWGVCTLLTHATISNGRVSVMINPKIADNLQSPVLYAKVHLIAASKMKKKNSMLLYEILLDHIGRKKSLTITLEKMLSMFLLSEDLKYKYLARNELKPVCVDINTHTDIYVTYSPIKEGRRTVAVAFKVEKNPNFQLDLDLQIDHLDKDHAHIQNLTNDLVERGVNESVADNLIREFTGTRIRDNIAVFDEAQSNGKVRQPGAYLKRAIENDYSGSTIKTVQSQSSISTNKSTAGKPKCISDDELKELHQEYRYAAAWKLFNEKTKTFQGRYKNQFVARMKETNNQMVLKKLNNHDWDSKMVKGHLMTAELIDKLLNEDPQYSFEVFKLRQQAQSAI